MMKYEILTIRFVSVTAGPSCIAVWLAVVVDCNRTTLFTIVIVLATEQNANREERWRWKCSISIFGRQEFEEGLE